MKKFEYKFFLCNETIIIKNVEEVLNKAGEDGWELCFMFPEHYYLFKREIEEHHPYE